MSGKPLIDELFEDSELDNEILKSFSAKDELDSKIFKMSNDTYKMDKTIREKLLKISDTFIDFIGVDFFVHDVVLTGSLANYNWSKFSDVDLHILVDMDENGKSKKINNVAYHDLVKEFLDAKKNVWNKTHNIRIKGYDVELYVQDVDEKHVSSGVFSILNNKWIIEPQKTKEFIDDRKIIEKGEEFMKSIDRLVSASKSGKDVTSEIDSLKDKIKKFRQSGLEKGGEYSYENLTFKLLRRNGYIEKIIRIKTDMIDKKLSITQ
jgi:predicted nucleotidyltransferase